MAFRTSFRSMRFSSDDSLKLKINCQGNIAHVFFPRSMINRQLTLPESRYLIIARTEKYATSTIRILCKNVSVEMSQILK